MRNRSETSRSPSGNGRDPPRLAPLVEAALEIVREPRRALVAIVGHLGQQLEDDLRRARRGQRTDAPIGRRRLARHVAVHPAEGVAGLERQPPGEQLVEGHAQRIEIRAAVDRPVHPPGLLGRHVRQRALDQSRRPRRWSARARRARRCRNRRSGPPRCAVEEDVVRLQILVDQPAPVDVGDGGGDARRQREEGLDRHRRDPRADRATRPRKSSSSRAGRPSKAGERERLDDRQALQRPADLVLVTQLVHVPRTAVSWIEHLEDQRLPSTPLTARKTEDRGPRCSRSPSTYADVAPTPLPDSSTARLAPDARLLFWRSRM